MWVPASNNERGLLTHRPSSVRRDALNHFDAPTHITHRKNLLVYDEPAMVLCRQVLRLRDSHKEIEKSEILWLHR